MESSVVQALCLKFKLHEILLGTSVVIVLFNKCLSCVYGSVITYLKNGKLLSQATIAVLKILQNQYEFVLRTCHSELHDTSVPGRRILISTNRGIVTKARFVQHVA